MLALSASAVARACLALRRWPEAGGEALGAGRDEEGGGWGEGSVRVMSFVWISWPGKYASGPSGICRWASAV